MNEKDFCIKMNDLDNNGCNENTFCHIVVISSLFSQYSSASLNPLKQPIRALERDDSGILLIDGPRSSTTFRTTVAGGTGSARGTGGGKSSSSGIQSLITTARQSRVRTITNETTTRRTSLNEDQILCEQDKNDQCDLMSLMRVHEHLTKQRSTTTSISSTSPLSSLKSPLHHESALAKPQILHGPPMSTPSQTSITSETLSVVSQKPQQQDDVGNPTQTTLIETGSLSTLNIPSAILHADERGRDESGQLT